MALWIWTLIGAAFAWAPAETRTVRMDAPVVGLSAGDWDGKLSAVAMLEKGFVVLGPDGKVRLRDAAPVRDVLLADLNGDGRGELLRCGDKGLSLIPAGATDSSGAIQLDTMPCVGVAARSRGSWSSVLVLDKEGVRELVPDAGGMTSTRVFTGQAKAVKSGGSKFIILTDGGVVVDGATVTASGKLIAAGPAGVAFADEEKVTLVGGPTFAVEVAEGLAVGVGGVLIWEDSPLATWLAVDGGTMPVALPQRPTLAAFGAGLCPGLWTVGEDHRDLVRISGFCGAPVVTESALPATSGEITPQASARAETASTGVAPQGEQRALSAGIPLTTPWSVLQVKVGERADTRVNLPVGSRVWARGTPKGMEVSREGALSFEPTAGQEGLWRISVHSRSPAGAVNGGFVVQVLPLGISDADARTLAPVLGSTRSHQRVKKTRGVFVLQQVDLHGGVLFGASKNQGSWATYDRGRTVISLAPLVGIDLNYGGPKVQWFFGADTAPFFAYATPTQLLPKAAAVQLGVTAPIGPVRVGPFAEAGVLMAGGGLRASLPLKDHHGLDVRATYWASSIGVQVRAAYTYSFGKVVRGRMESEG